MLTHPQTAALSDASGAIVDTGLFSNISRPYCIINKRSPAVIGLENRTFSQLASRVSVTEHGSLLGLSGRSLENKWLPTLPLVWPLLSAVHVRYYRRSHPLFSLSPTEVNISITSTLLCWLNTVQEHTPPARSWRSKPSSTQPDLRTTARGDKGLVVHSDYNGAFRCSKSLSLEWIAPKSVYVPYILKYKLGTNRCTCFTWVFSFMLLCTLFWLLLCTFYSVTIRLLSSFGYLSLYKSRFLHPNIESAYKYISLIINSSAFLWVYI